MFQIWSYTIISVIIVSLISLVGIFFLTINDSAFRKIITYLVSFSTGALFGDVFIHILPEVAHEYGFSLKVSVSVLAGILVFFVLEKFICWHHCHTDVCEDHPRPVAYINMVGDGVHNFIDGMIIAGAFMTNITLGLATTMAVVVHEIPTEMGHYSILVYAGFSKMRALWFNFLSALTAIMGGVITLLAYEHVKDLSEFLLPFTAGGFIYLAGSDLIPELHKVHEVKRSLMQFFFILLGIGLMFALLVVA